MSIKKRMETPVKNLRISLLMEGFSKFIISVLVLILFVHCKSGQVSADKKMSEIGKPTLWGYVGWGVNPDILVKGEIPTNPTEKDWFYALGSGKANPRSIELNSPSFMQTTCKLSVLKENQKKIFDDAIVSSVPQAKDNPDMKKKGLEALGKQETEIAMCKPTGDKESFQTCDCVIYIKYTGGKEALSAKILAK